MTQQIEASSAQLITPDARLADAHARFDAGEITVWALAALEHRDLADRPTLEVGMRVPRGTLVLDRDGDVWRKGNTRWTCLVSGDGGRVRAIGRLTQSELLRQHGPVREIGTQSRWRYRTIRGRA
jgi:hypothetical protein